MILILQADCRSAVQLIWIANPDQRVLVNDQGFSPLFVLLRVHFNRVYVAQPLRRLQAGCLSMNKGSGFVQHLC